jgi:DNA repair exonuclease SbcCD ATPase subunit
MKIIEQAFEGDFAKYLGEGKAVKKMAKLAVGDLIFFNDGQAGIVYKIGDDKSLSFLHVVNGQVMISSSESLSYKCGTHITSDKELSSLRKEYEKEQKAIAKAQEQHAKAQAEAAKAAEKAEKERVKAEKEAQKAQEKIDKANKEAAKAAAKAEKAEQKLNDVTK